jgi:hypothetical protein
MLLTDQIVQLEMKWRIVIQPCGHGALIENLNDLDADIFIKTLTMLFFKIMRLLLYIKGSWMDY